MITATTLESSVSWASIWLDDSDYWLLLRAGRELPGSTGQLIPSTQVCTDNIEKIEIE